MKTYNKRAGKSKHSLSVVLYICVVLVFSVILGMAAAWRAMADTGHDTDLDRFFYETSRLITQNWCDGFIESIILTVGAPYIYVDGNPVEIDPDSAPVVVNSQKYLPAYVLVEATGGQTSFDSARQRITVYDNRIIEQQVGYDTVTKDGRMLPAYVIAESMGFELDWDPTTQEITLTRNFQTRRLIVRAAAGADFSDTGATDIVGGPSNITVLQFASIQEAKEAYNRLRGLPYVDWVEPDLYLPPVSGMSYHDYITPFNAGPMSWGVERSGLDRYAEYLRDNGKNRQIIVAVVDTGVQAYHPFLRGRVMTGWCTIRNRAESYDVKTHGTNVAGVIVDATQGLDVRILPVRVFDSHDGATVLSLANGILWAASRADVINISVGGRSQYYYFMLDVVRYAINRNTIVVAAAGNSAADARYYFPANVPGIITAAATNSNNRPASFTNWGPAITLAAPGVNIYSPGSNGGFMAMAGTSMSAPHIAAAAAMYKMNHPCISQPDMKAALTRYVYVPPGWDTRYGAGILYMIKAIPCGFYEIIPPCPPKIIPGNVTGSGRVSAADVAMLRAYLAGYPVEIIREAADVNGDGFITAADVALIRAYLAGYPVNLAGP